MDIETKIKEDMRSLGCTSEAKITLAYHLYIHLIEAKLMYDTEYCYNKDIDTLYIVARPVKNEKLNIYVPILTSEDISLEFIEKIQENLCTVETGSKINLAFVEGDFTTVIYSFSRGLCDIQPEKAAETRMREERRVFINNGLKKNKNEILNNASNGGVVDDDDCLVLE